MKVEAIDYGDRKVYSVAAFNRGVADWLAAAADRLGRGRGHRAAPAAALAERLLHAQGPGDGACLAVTMPRGQFDALRLELADGERVHVYGRPELFEQRGDFRLRALSIERFGLGAAPRGARAAEAEARRRGALRGRAEARRCRACRAGSGS